MTSSLFDWARRTLDGFVAAGVRDVVISPGSRSTPFVLAAARHSHLHAVDVVDERSAGFFALGQARASGVPSLLLCTSGTAGAHYLPAVVEASAAGVPLVVLTADRPGERLECGAPQVTDQRKLYGDFVRVFVELGLPDPSPRALRAVAARCSWAASRSRWPLPGPVHVNAAARKPLEPSAEEMEEGVASSEMPCPVVAEPRSTASEEALAELALRLRTARRPLVVAGPGPLTQRGLRPAFAGLMETVGFPCLLEWTSQLRHRGVPPGALLDAGAALLGSSAFRRRHRPDLLLQVGAAPVSAGWEDLAEENLAAFHAVLSHHQLHDPVRTADSLVFGDLSATLGGLSEALRGRELTMEEEWVESLVAANREARAAIEKVATEIAAEVAARGAPARSGLGEAPTVRAVLEELPQDGLVALGNSLPIRWCELFGPPPSDCAVWCQRGVNGIDGLVSGAAGSAHALSRSIGPSPPLSRFAGSAHALSRSAGSSRSLSGGDEQPSATVLLLGDLALQHDLGGLATLELLGRDGCAPFVIVVINNHGGRIFEQLPIAERGLEAAELRHWTTPHRRTFAAAAELFDLAYESPGSTLELRSTLRGALVSRRATLIEIEVEADAARRERRQLRELLG